MANDLAFISVLGAGTASCRDDVIVLSDEMPVGAACSLGRRHDMAKWIHGTAI